MIIIIPLFLTNEVNEIKKFTSETKLSNYKQGNHYRLFNHYVNFLESIKDYSF